jgi:hypothetical protein
VRGAAVVVPPARAANLTRHGPRSSAAVTLPTLAVGEKASCHVRYNGTIAGVSARSALDMAHYASAGAVSFAGGLNDTSKIAALPLVGGAVARRCCMKTLHRWSSVADDVGRVAMPQVAGSTTCHPDVVPCGE